MKKFAGIFEAGLLPLPRRLVVNFAISPDPKIPTLL